MQKENRTLIVAYQSMITENMTGFSKQFLSDSSNRMKMAYNQLKKILLLKCRQIVCPYNALCDCGELLKIVVGQFGANLETKATR